MHLVRCHLRNHLFTIRCRQLQWFQRHQLMTHLNQRWNDQCHRCHQLMTPMDLTWTCMIQMHRHHQHMIHSNLLQYIVQYLRCHLSILRRILSGMDKLMILLPPPWLLPPNHPFTRRRRPLILLQTHRCLPRMI